MRNHTISRDALLHNVQKWIHQARQEGQQEGQQLGIHQGRQEGATVILFMWLQRQVGDLDPGLQVYIRRLSFDQLVQLAADLSTFSSPADVKRWLDLNARS